MCARNEICVHGMESLNTCHGICVYAILSALDFHRKPGSESLGMKAWEWKPGNGSLGMEAWEWKPGNGSLGMEAWEWKPGNGSLGMEAWEWKLGCERLGISSGNESTNCYASPQGYPASPSISPSVPPQWWNSHPGCYGTMAYAGTGPAPSEPLCTS